MGLLVTVLVVILLAIILGAAYFVISIKRSQQYWKKKNVFTLKTRYPLLGHMAPVILRTQSFPELVNSFYKEAHEAGKDFAGMYMFTRQALVLANPELIGEVTIKQFEHFINRRPFVDQSVNRLLGRSLLGLQNEEWREMRHHLSPAFTGSKLRGMMDLIESTCHKFTEFLSKRDSNEPLDVYASFRKLGVDIIATTAFGTPCDSINDTDCEFYKNGIKIMDFSGLRGFVVIGYLIAPKFMQWLNIPFVSQPVTNFFNNQIFGSISFREKENKSRADMIQLLLDARKANPSKYIENADIASQAFNFFLGGFDTIATGFSFTAHCLAMNPEIQTKVRDEIISVTEKHGGKMTYDGLKDLKYLDMVIAEVLRMHPAAPMLDRLCSNNVHFPEFGLTVEKGVSLVIPIYGLHYNPEYFPDPYKFDPERFSDENKANIKPYTYLPFGEGPRNCIGKRFALLELKLGLSHILMNYEFQVCEKTDTKNPMQYTTKSTLVQPEGGFWLNVKRVSEI